MLLSNEQIICDTLDTIIGGSCNKYHFCRDKTRLLPRKKNILTATKLLSRQNYVCRDKMFLTSQTCFWERQHGAFRNKTLQVLFLFILVASTPWYNRNGWLSVKPRSYLLTLLPVGQNVFLGKVSIVQVFILVISTGQRAKTCFEKAVVPLRRCLNTTCMLCWCDAGRELACFTADLQCDSLDNTIFRWMTTSGRRSSTLECDRAKGDPLNPR